MQVISLKEFLKSGAFGSIEPSVSTKQDVINLMGNQFEFGDCGETQILKYGWYEFFFWTDSEIVFGIQNDQLPVDCTNHDEMVYFENDQVRIDTWFIKANTTYRYHEVVDLLKQEQIKFTIERLPHRGAVDQLRLNSGVTIDFDNCVRKSVYNETTQRWVTHETMITDPQLHFLNGIRYFDDSILPPRSDA